MKPECSICGKTDDLTCPICDKLFCINCFADHGKQCYNKSKTEQGVQRCTACGRYASVKPLVHCSDCGLEYCRSCLYGHRKTHAEQAELCTVCQKAINPKSYMRCSDCHERFHIKCYSSHRVEEQRKKQQEQEQVHCISCGSRLFVSMNYMLCGTCNKPVCGVCDISHQNTHKTTCAHCHKSVYRDITDVCNGCGQRVCVLCMSYHKKQEHKQQDPSTGNFCVNCGKPKSWGGRFTTCGTCNGPVCFSCEQAHAQQHMKSFARCSNCGKRTATECNECHKPYCSDCFPAHNRWVHEPPQHANARGTYTWINLDDFKINFDPPSADPEWLKKQTEDMRRVREEVEAERRKQQMRTCPLCQKQYTQLVACPECKKQYCASCYPNHAYQHRMKRQQEDFFNSFYGFNRERTTGTATAPQTTHDAFRLLGLSQRATVQEVKHAFRRMAKQGEYRHPDTGGSKEAFIKLNNAYELALKEAERNER